MNQAHVRKRPVGHAAINAKNGSAERSRSQTLRKTQNVAKKRQSDASAQPRPLGCELERLRAEQLRARRRAVDKRVSPLLRFTPPRTPAPSYEFSSLPPAPPHAARSRPRSELKRQTALKPKSEPKPKSKPKRRQGFRPWLGAETYASTNPRKVPWQGSRRRTKG